MNNGEVADVLFSISLLPFAFQITHYYIDPGTGLLVIQVLIAGLIGSFFFLKTFWGRVGKFLKNLLSRIRKNND